MYQLSFDPIILLMTDKFQYRYAPYSSKILFYLNSFWIFSQVYNPNQLEYPVFILKHTRPLDTLSIYQESCSSGDRKYLSRLSRASILMFWHYLKIIYQQILKASDLFRACILHNYEWYQVDSNLLQVFYHCHLIYSNCGAQHTLLQC